MFQRGDSKPELISRKMGVMPIMLKVRLEFSIDHIHEALFFVLNGISIQFSEWHLLLYWI
jgi:hypothetical protein